MTLLGLAILAVLEAVVYRMRIRAAVGASPAASALWVAALGALRIAFVQLGVSAAIGGEWWGAVLLVYVVPAAVVDYAIGFSQRSAERREPCE